MADDGTYLLLIGCYRAGSVAEVYPRESRVYRVYARAAEEYDVAEEEDGDFADTVRWDAGNEDGERFGVWSCSACFFPVRGFGGSGLGHKAQRELARLASDELN